MAIVALRLASRVALARRDRERREESSHLGGSACAHFFWPEARAGRRRGRCRGGAWAWRPRCGAGRSCPRLVGGVPSSGGSGRTWGRTSRQPSGRRRVLSSRRGALEVIVRVRACGVHDASCGEGGAWAPGVASRARRVRGGAAGRTRKWRKGREQRKGEGAERGREPRFAHPRVGRIAVCAWSVGGPFWGAVKGGVLRGGVGGTGAAKVRRAVLVAVTRRARLVPPGVRRPDRYTPCEVAECALWESLPGQSHVIGNFSYSVCVVSIRLRKEASAGRMCGWRVGLRPC